MGDSAHGSDYTDKTAERIFPARTLVKSPLHVVDNPFNKVFGKRVDRFADSFSRNRADEVLASRQEHRASESPLSPNEEKDDELSSERQDESSEDSRALQSTAQSSQPSDDIKARPLTTNFDQLDRVKDNRGTEKVQDIASTHPAEAKVEAEFEHRTQRFEHRMNEDGTHQVFTGLDDAKVQACEDEPIHIPGAIQSFGVLITVRQVGENLEVVHVSENSGDVMGLSPDYLFRLSTFTSILPESERLALQDQLDFLEESNSSEFAINNENTSYHDAEANVSPEVFLLSGHQEDSSLPLWKCWTAIHRTIANGDLILFEFELYNDNKHPLRLVKIKNESPATSRPDQTPERGLSLADKAGMEGDGFDAFSEEDLLESTVSVSRPLRRVKRSVLSGNEDGTMEIFSLLSQINSQLSDASDLQEFLKTVAGIVKEITSFHRVMIYQFDEQWNGQVVAELVDWSQTKDLFRGLSFPATDIPAQARTLYKLNKVRTLYDRDQPTARLVCRNKEALATPLDMTHCFLRAMSPIHLKYLANMGVRSSMSISITAFGELWGLIACHSYGDLALRCSFLVRKLCRLMGEQISHNIERLSYAARLTARKIIHTPNERNPSGYIVSKAEDLLGLFDADLGMLSIGDEGKFLGPMENSQEALALREYFRTKRFETITPSSDLRADFPDLEYGPGFKTIAGVMYIPLSRSGEDFLLFFRRGHLRKVHWAGNPYEKVLEKNKGMGSILLPRQSFKVWSESVIGKCKEWAEEQVETAAVLCLVYGKFIEVWREKQQVMQTSKLASLLLTNAGHEVRTPLNAVINYLEIALEGDLPPETRESLEKSHTASKSLVYVINDLLDLTKSEQGHDLFRNEPFDLVSSVREAVSMYQSQATRADVNFTLEEDPDLPRRVLGDQAKIRQVIGNVTANALKYTTEGSVTVQTKALGYDGESVQVAIIVKDTGCGISEERLDAIFSNFELVEIPDMPESQEGSTKGRSGTGLGLAIVARVVRNMNGQLKATSKIGRGSTFTFIFDFVIADEQLRKQSIGSSQESTTTAKNSQHPGLNGSRSGSKPATPRPGPSKTFAPYSQLHDDAASQSSDTSEVDVDPTTGERTWPTNEKHVEAKEKRDVQRAHSTASRSGKLRQQINEMRQKTSDHRDSSGRSNIEDIMSSMIATPLASEVSGSAEAGGRSRGPRTDRGALSDTSGSPMLQDQTWNRGSPTNDLSIKEANSHHDDHQGRDHGDEQTVATGHRISASQEHDDQAVTSQLATLDEKVSTGAGMSNSVVNTRTRVPMRGVKLDSQEVSVPQKYEKNSISQVFLGPSSRSSSARRLKDGGSHAGSGTLSKVPPLNILVAEDDAINRSILKKRLEIDDHRIKLAFHGLECYEAYSKDTKAYDVILMDMQMPVLDGMGAARKIRELEATCYADRKSPIPIIAVSASLLESQVEEAIAAGIDGWILKPVNFVRLKQFFASLTDGTKRREFLYSAGTHQDWEKGGWLTDL